MTVGRVRALDRAIVLFVVVAVLINLTGGFYAEPWGIRISMRKFERPLVLAIILAALRWYWYRREPFLGLTRAEWRAPWRAWYRADADPPLFRGARKWWQSALAVMGIGAVGAVFLRAQLQNMMGISDFGDPLFSIWRVGWIHRQLQGDPRPLFDANIFYPTPLTLTFSDPILLLGLTGAPFLSAGLHPAVVNSILMISAFLLSGIATYFLVVRLTGSAMAGFVAGVLWGFHPYRFEHYGHLEQVSTHWIPLALLAILKLAETWKLRWALAAAFCVVGQFYTCLYVAVFFPVYALPVLGTLLLLRSRPDWRQIVKPLAIAGVLAVLAMLPVVRPFMKAQAMKGDRTKDAVRFYSADFSDYLRPHHRSATYNGYLLDSSDKFERALFPGASMLVLAGVSLAPPVGAVRLALGAGGLLALDLSRGMKGFTYPTLYEVFPPMRGMRVPARYSIILGLSLAALSGYGALRLVRRVRSSGLRAVAWIGLIAFVLVDLRPDLQLETVWEEPPRIYNHIKDLPHVVLAEFPPDPPNPIPTSEVAYQYFSVWHWKPLLNGYSGFILEDHMAMMDELSSFPDDHAIDILRRKGVTHVTVNCYFMGGGGPCKDYLTAVDQQPALKLINISHWKGWPTRIYELLR